MSTKLYVYVGPFLSCSPKGSCDAYTVTNGFLTALSSEDAQLPDRDVLYPENIQGLDRQMAFDPHAADLTPVSIDANRRTQELQVFYAEFRELMAKLRQHYTEVRLDWGVVPYFY